MLKRLTAFVLAMLLLCPAALAGQPTIHLKKVQAEGKGPTGWFATQQDKDALIALVASEIKANSTFRTMYSGFKVDEALSNACAGIDENGKIFVAMLNEKTDIMLAVIFDSQTCMGTYFVKAHPGNLYEQYQYMAGNTWTDPETQLRNIEDMYAMADATMVIEDAALVRRFHEATCVKGGQTWYKPKSNMAVLALVVHYQFSRAPKEGLFETAFDGANALGTCCLMERATAPDTLALAYLDDEAHTLLISEIDLASMTLTCRLFRNVYLTNLGRFTTVYDRALSIDPDDILMAMIDVNVALSADE